MENIRPYLTSDSVLENYFSKLKEEYKTKLKNHLIQYQKVLIQHTIFALKKIEQGKETHICTVYLIIIFFTFLLFSQFC